MFFQDFRCDSRKIFRQDETFRNLLRGLRASVSIRLGCEFEELRVEEIHRRLDVGLPEMRFVGVNGHEQTPSAWCTSDIGRIELTG